MDFIINNYIIFIIIGVILLMALIGYIADNTNFEKKPKKEKKAKKDKKKQKEDVVTELESTDVVTSIPDENVETNPLDTPSELDTPVETDTKDATEVSNDGLMDAFETPSDLTSENVEPTEAEPVSNPETVAVEESTPNVDPMPMEEPAPVEETVETPEEPKDQGEATTTEENKENTDDIWKF